MKRKMGSSQQLSLFSPSEENESMMRDNRRLVAENQRIRGQLSELAEEITRLRYLLNQYSEEHEERKYVTELSENALPRVNEESPNIVTKRSSIEEKVKLFRSYFKGRNDVYAVNTPERDGKVRYYVQRQYGGWENGKPIWGDTLPLTNDVIKMHLTEEKKVFIVGLYPMLLDETCWFLAIDFDKASWKEDALAFLQVCDQWHVSAGLERSRSGNGGHVWIFFSEPVVARIARALGTGLLTKTLEIRHQTGLDSYDRMFPNQDTLPKKKKLGNLIALPLQRMAGKAGHSLFVDHHFETYSDQWVFLSSLRKMKSMEVENIVREMVLSGDVLSVGKYSDDENQIGARWELAVQEKASSPKSWPERMQVVLADLLYMQKSQLNSSHISFLKRLAAFQNPEFYQAQALRLSTARIPRIIDCSIETSDYLGLPRGCKEELEGMCTIEETQMIFDDTRNPGTPINTTFQGNLREEQNKAADQLLRYDIGTLVAATGFGKTVVAAWMIAARGTNTLVLVDSVQLQQQWREALSMFFGISQDDIGAVGGGKSKRTGVIDVILFQSTYSHKDKKVKEYVREYGHVIVDECHHLSAFTFEQVMRKVTAKYVLGLTATLVRKDGKHPIVLMQCGPVRYRVTPQKYAGLHPFVHVMIPRHTGLKLPACLVNLGIQEIYRHMAENKQRNDMIFDDLLNALEAGRSPLLLTGRRDHLEYFEERLTGFAKNVIVLRGGMGKRQLAAAQDKLRNTPPNEERVILATGRFIGEGFDDERLDTLFLVMPVAWKGTLQQYAGRLHRIYDQKREVQIYDYVDDQIPMLERMYQKRLKGYKGMGYVTRD